MSPCTKRDTPHPRDGCYAWFVSFSCFCGISICMGTISSFSALLPIWSDEFELSRGATAWIGSITTGLLFMFAPVAIKIYLRYNERIIGFCGCLAVASFLIASSFVNKIYILYITHGLFMGLGISCCFYTFLLLIKKWFVRNLGLAIGIVIAGSSIGTMIMNPITQLICDSIGWRNALRVMSGIWLLVAILCLSFTSNVERDPENDDSVVDNGCMIKYSDVFDCSLWKSPKYTIGMIVIWMTFFGFFVGLIHIIAFAKDRKIPGSKASLLFIFIGGCSTVSRILIGKVNDKKWLSTMRSLQLGSFIIGSSLIPLTQAKEFYHFIIFAVYYGIGNGIFATMQNLFLMTCFGDSKKDAVGFGMGQVVKSIPIFGGPPIAADVNPTETTKQDTPCIASITGVGCVSLCTWKHLMLGCDINSTRKRNIRNIYMYIRTTDTILFN